MRSLVLLLMKVLTGSAVLSVLLHDHECTATSITGVQTTDQAELQAQPLLSPPVESAVLSPEARSAVDDTDSTDDDPELRQHNKIKIKKKPKLKKAKKMLKKLLPFLLIPLLIQAKLVPLFLLKLKLVALKALGIGKLALLLILINVIYNTVHGADTGDQKYSQDVLASEHYGYNGGPEVGAWVNKRLFNVHRP